MKKTFWHQAAEHTSVRMVASEAADAGGNALETFRKSALRCLQEQLEVILQSGQSPADHEDVICSSFGRMTRAISLLSDAFEEANVEEHRKAMKAQQITFGPALLHLLSREPLRRQPPTGSPTRRR